MSLVKYFNSLIDKVESSGEISNLGKDENGFFKPTKTVVLRHLNLLKDLHQKPMAKKMVQGSWQVIVKELPAEWLILTDEEKKELKEILSDS